MYEVIEAFDDLFDYVQTKGGRIFHHYSAGDRYPREGHDVPVERIAELAGSNNRRGIPLIRPLFQEEAAAEEVPEKPVESKSVRKRRKIQKEEEE